MIGMNLRFNGRPVAWFGVGEPDVIGSGIAALETSVVQYGRSPNFGGAVTGFQKAGAVAVNTVGPAIDSLSGGNPAVMKATQSAWQQNARLASVNNSDSAGRADVDTAKGIVDQMIFVYKQAVNLASSLAPKAADGDQGIATSRVNIPSTPTPRPRPKGFSSPTPQSAAVTAPPTTPPAVPDAPSDSGWLVPALIVGGIAVAVGGVALVAATRGRGTA